MLNLIDYVAAITPTAPYYVHPMHGHFYVLGPGVIDGAEFPSREDAERAAKALHDAYRFAFLVNYHGNA